MGVSFLLDTRVFLWWLGDPQRIPDSVREQVGDPALSVWVSAVSAMEVATKTRLGKLPDVGLGGPGTGASPRSARRSSR